MSGYQTWKNIILRNITITNPEGSPGVNNYDIIIPKILLLFINNLKKNYNDNNNSNNNNNYYYYYWKVLFGNTSNPIQNLVFDNVNVINPGNKPFGENYYCEGIKNGIAIGGTSPKPTCFE